MRVLHIVASDARRGAEVFASDLQRALSELGVAQACVTVRRPGSSSLQAIGGLRRAIRSFRPHVVQAHGGDPLKWAALNTDGASLVYRRIGTAPLSLQRTSRRLLYGGLMRRARRVIAVAEVVRAQTLTLFHLPPHRVITIPNGIDAARLRVVRGRETTRRLLGIGDEVPVILSLGAVSWEKDPHAHLAVTRRVLSHRPEAIHIFAGDGPLRGWAEETARSQLPEGQVRFLGVREDVADLLAASDVLLFASRPDGMEGMPAVLIEAGVCGLPVAGFDIAGASEVVRDGITGRLVPWRDTDLLADAVLELCDPSMSIGPAERQHCLASFSIEPIAERYLRVYEEVAASR